MKFFTISALFLAIYLVVLATYAWYERELITTALGILPLLLITVVRAFDRSAAKSPAVAASRQSLR